MRLNNCMKNRKPTQLQRQFESKAQKDTKQSNDWLKENGINSQTFAFTHVKLIQAQQKAHDLLTNFKGLLTSAQEKKLKDFQIKMNTGYIRKKLKPEAAKAIFVINTQVKRKAHKLAQEI